MASKQQAVEALKIKGAKSLTVIICDHKEGTYTIEECETVFMVTAQKNALTRGTMSRFITAGLLGIKRNLEMFMNFVMGMARTFPDTREYLEKGLKQALKNEGEKDESKNQGEAN